MCTCLITWEKCPPLFSETLLCVVALYGFGNWYFQEKSYWKIHIFLSVVLGDKYLIAGLHLNCFGRVKGAISAAGWGKKNKPSVTNIMLNGRSIVCRDVKCVFCCQLGFPTWQWLLAAYWVLPEDRALALLKKLFPLNKGLCSTADFQHLLWHIFRQNGDVRSFEESFHITKPFWAQPVLSEAEGLLTAWPQPLVQY